MTFALSLENLVILSKLGCLRRYRGIEVYLVNDATSVEFATFRKLVPLHPVMFIVVSFRRRIHACWEDRPRVPVHNKGRGLSCTRWPPEVVVARLFACNNY